MNYQVTELNEELKTYLQKRNLEKKWTKAKFWLEKNLSYPSLNFEKILLKSTCFYSFRLDKKFRGLCIINKNTIEIIAFTKHYE